jgi:hypothetical protein
MKYGCITDSTARGWMVDGLMHSDISTLEVRDLMGI